MERLSLEDLNDGGSVILKLTDPDVLDCPICYLPLSAPIYQCENGHILCGGCILKINNKCPTCKCRIGQNRCRAIENVLEALKVSCPNAKYGCKSVLSHRDNSSHIHEYVCKYTRCYCPERECGFNNSALNLFKHIHTNHTTHKFRFGCRITVFLDKNKTYVFLREETEGVVFVLNRVRVHDVTALSAVSVDLVAPEVYKGQYRYEVEVKDGEKLLVVKSPVESVPKLEYVIEAYNNFLERLAFDICISRLGDEELEFV